MALLLALAMVLLLPACGGNAGSDAEKGNDNPYNLEDTSDKIQPMSNERASKEVLLEAGEYYRSGLSSVSAEVLKQTYKDVAEHIGVDASEYQYFESYGQHRYTWYVEGNDGPALLVVFDLDGTLFSVSSSIS